MVKIQGFQLDAPFWEKLIILASILLLIITSGIYAAQTHGGTIAGNVPGAVNSSNWQVAGGVEKPYLLTNTTLSMDGVSAIQFGGNFSKLSTFPEVQITLTENQPLSLANSEYVLFSLYATPDLLSRTSFQTQVTTPFSFSLTISSQDRENKTYGPYTIGWKGWQRFALPLHYSGLVIAGNLTNPYFQGVNETTKWNDDFSLERITQIRLSLTANHNSTDNSLHSLILNNLQTAYESFSTLEEANALIDGTSIVVLIFLVPVFFVRHARRAAKIPILSSTKAFFSEFRYAQTNAKLLATVIAVKVLAMVATPLSSDFIDDLRGSLPLAASVNPLTNSPLFGGYMLTLRYIMFKIWLIFPVDHPDPLQIFPGNFFSPTFAAGIFHFPSTPGAFLLVELLKTPNLMADILIAVIMYKTVLTAGASERAASAATTLWLINPYDTLIVEMWSNFEILFLLPLIWGVYYVVKNRTKLSALLYGLSLGVRLWAILLFPFFLGSIPDENGKKRTRLLFAGLTTLFGFLAIAPFLIANYLVPSSAGSAVIVYSDLPDLEFFLGYKIQLSNFALVLLVVFLTLFLYLLSDWWKPSSSEIPTVLLVFFLILFSVAKWLPHWLLWIMPFLALDLGLTNRPKKYYATLILIGFATAFVAQSWYFASWGNSFFFFPNYTSQLTFLSQAMTFISGIRLVSTITAASLLESAFVGVCLAYLVRVLTGVGLKKRNRF